MKKFYLIKRYQHSQKSNTSWKQNFVSIDKNFAVMNTGNNCCTEQKFFELNTKYAISKKK